MIMSGGYTSYGQDIGILMLDTKFPRIRGDIGNAETFSFPVRYKVVQNAVPQRVVLDNDRTLLDAFIAGAKELEAEGVKAITTSCGFLAIYQNELASAVAVPVFTSSLLQIPLARNIIAPWQKVIIVTAHSGKLSTQHLKGAGAGEISCPIVGMENRPEFVSVFLHQKTTLDIAVFSEEVQETAREIKAKYPEAGAIVLECTNLPPFRHVFQEITGCPVFDIVTLVHTIKSAFMPVNYL